MIKSDETVRTVHIGARNGRKVEEECYTTSQAKKMLTRRNTQMSTHSEPNDSAAQTVLDYFPAPSTRDLSVQKAEANAKREPEYRRQNACKKAFIYRREDIWKLGKRA